MQCPVKSLSKHKNISSLVRSMKLLPNLIGGAPPLALLSSRLAAALLGTEDGAAEPEEPPGRSAKYESPAACAESSGIDSEQNKEPQKASFRATPSQLPRLMQSMKPRERTVCPHELRTEWHVGAIDLARGRPRVHFL